MASNVLKSAVKTISKGTRLADDMQVRNDLLMNDEIVHEVLFKNENPYSPFRIFGGGNSFFSSSYGFTPGEVYDDIEYAVKGHDMAYIARKEVSKVHEQVTVASAPEVQDSLPVGYRFELELSHPLDPDEYVMLRDGKTQLYIHSRRESSGLSYTHTVSATGSRKGIEVKGLRSKLGVGDVVIPIGNSQGEASRKSNTLRTPGSKSVLFYQPMKIQRYFTTRTGSAVADRLYAYERQLADGSVNKFYLRLDEELVQGSLRQFEYSLMFSRANFNAETLEINTTNQGSNYSERPIYAGILEQLEQARYKHKIRKGVNDYQKLTMLESIHSSMVSAGVLRRGEKFGIIALGAAARRWVYDALLKGGLAKTQAQGVQLTKELGANNQFVGGIQLGKYFFPDGSEAVMYDVASSLTGGWEQYFGGMDTFTYEGESSPIWANKIYFVPLGRGRSFANLYNKEGIDPITGTKVKRGFVFGYSKGITGTGGNGIDSSTLKGIGESELAQMLISQMQNGQAAVNSLVDADEIHMLSEHTILLNNNGLHELELLK